MAACVPSATHRDPLEMRCYDSRIQTAPFEVERLMEGFTSAGELTDSSGGGTVEEIEKSQRERQRAELSVLDEAFISTVMETEIKYCVEMLSLDACRIADRRMQWQNL